MLRKNIREVAGDKLSVEGWRLHEVLLLAYLLVFLVYGVHGNYILDQGGTQWSASGYTSDSSVDSWYPGGLPENEQFIVTVHKDTGTGEQSVVFYTGADSSTNADVGLGSIPSGSSVKISDDSGEFSVSQNPEGQWSWSSSDTDGGALALGSDWSQIEIDPSAGSMGPDFYFRGENNILDLSDNEILTILRDSPLPAKNPQPYDGYATDSDTNTISAEYDHPRDRSGHLYFYETSGSFIGKCPVSDGERCGVSWGPLSHGENDWYVKAGDGASNTTGPVWTLVVNNDPDQTLTPQAPFNGEKIYGDSVDLEMSASDPDDDPLTTTFYTNVSGEEGSDTGTSPTIQVDSLQRGDTYEWYGVVSDGWNTTESEHWTFSVNSLPAFFNPQPEDDGVGVGSPTQISINVTDSDQADDDLTVYFYNASDDTFFGKETVENGDAAEASVTSVGLGERFRWYVKASDGDENATSQVYEFIRSATEVYRTRMSIEYKYSSVILDPSTTRDIILTIENEVEDDKQLTTYLTNVEAQFADGTSKKSYVLEGESSKEFRVRITDQTPGQRNLIVKTENSELAVNTTESIPVMVRENPSVAGSQQVSGIGMLQVLAIVLLSTSLYFVQL